MIDEKGDSWSGRLRSHRDDCRGHADLTIYWVANHEYALFVAHEDHPSSFGLC
jgi:hypothetical protein